jgi:hypothetical protein
MKPGAPKLLAICLYLGSFVACGSEERPKAEPQPLQVPSHAPAKADVPPPTPDELPVPEDFEAEAERLITRANLRTQLDAIEREINADRR